ncbi:site-2 protease family protein [Thermohalobacter berrensis]|uniref:Peptidase M50 domain-containing protein n=1 Tax=Thermohalobacter berrensis TaxID=99594 RepID=A0A419T6W1_9FIRM|nr:site-2 protease family protein [Thermohalobacter berrensis]RKD33211.1 hypothetical protein BET03_09880 [Thermohalobacter berrensis]
MYFKPLNLSFKINYFLLILIIFYFFLGYGIEITIIFITILIHEISHIITARKLGLQVKEIELFPFGGLARLETIIGTKPKTEIFVAITGPIVSIFLAMIFIFLKIFILNNYIISFIIKSNLYIGLFNLLPIFPMDGGRVLRAYFSYIIGFRKATDYSVKLSYFFVFLMISYGLYRLALAREGIYIIIIPIFVLFAAKKEKKMAVFIFFKELIEKKEELIKKHVMKSHNLVGLKTTKARTVLENFLPQKYHFITIVNKNGQYLGTISEKELLDGIIKYGFDVTLEKLLIMSKKW